MVVGSASGDTYMVGGSKGSRGEGDAQSAAELIKDVSGISGVIQVSVLRGS